MRKTFSTFLTHAPKYTTALFVAISVLVSFMPFTLRLPTSTLDGSWAFALNEAIARGLVFGKDIVFTFGPYASLYTYEYHPATDHLMMWGCLLLATGYLTLLLWLSKGIRISWMLAYAAFILIYWYMRDPWLFSYGLLLSLLTYRLTLPNQHSYHLSLSKYFRILYVALFVILGLLPLIKSGLLIVTLYTVFLCSLLLYYHKEKLLVCWIILTPILSSIMFWMLAGQPLNALPHFFLSSNPIIAGYTEAMSLSGVMLEIYLYIISCILIFVTIIANKIPSYRHKIILFLFFALFLFMSFKAGFVRHDGHAVMAGTAIIIAALSINFVTSIKEKWLYPVLFFSLMSFWYIDKTYMQISTNSIYQAFRYMPPNIITALKYRFVEPEALKALFNDRLNQIHAEFPIPPLHGTSDIYSYQQAFLLASKNTWSPRPVFQSYAAYTPELAELNLQHLLGPKAPDNIVFAIQNLDYRYPSLDDGLSWPILINNYSIVKSQGDFIYLKKRTSPKQTNETIIYEGTHQLDEIVPLPLSNQLLFAEIDISPTFLNKILSIIYKPPMLKITVTLQDGTQKDFRFFSNMGKSRFLLSPLVETTKEFASLNTPRKLSGKMIKKIKISTSYGKGILWKTNYSIKLKTVE